MLTKGFCYFILTKKLWKLLIKMEIYVIRIKIDNVFMGYLFYYNKLIKNKKRDICLLSLM